MAQAREVAVVIPVFNRRLKLINTLETVAAQSELPALVVVVDDGSTDGTAKAAEEWLAHNARFRWRVISQANSGVSIARNVGFAHIEGLPLVCFLDSDDLWPPNFIAEGLRALEGRDDLLAAIADKARFEKGRTRLGQSLAPIASNPLLWLICNDGSILSCTMIRSEAARKAGLFQPMDTSEDTDFLMRLFLLGGVEHSKAAPVVFVKGEPLEPTEPPNLGAETPERRHLWARQLEMLASKLPEDLLEKHRPLIRTAVARRWAAAALLARQKGRRRLALLGLVWAIRWDIDWKRQLALIWSFLWGRRKVLARFSTPYRQMKR